MTDVGKRKILGFGNKNLQELKQRLWAASNWLKDHSSCTWPGIFFAHPVINSNNLSRGKSCVTI